MPVSGCLTKEASALTTDADFRHLKKTAEHLELALGPPMDASIIYKQSLFTIITLKSTCKLQNQELTKCGMSLPHAVCYKVIRNAQSLLSKLRV